MHESMWVQFLRIRGICRNDCYGNMPCDYGVLCDKCLDEDIQQEFKNWIKTNRKDDSNVKKLVQ